MLTCRAATPPTITTPPFSMHVLPSLPLALTLPFFLAAGQGKTLRIALLLVLNFFLLLKWHHFSIIHLQLGSMHDVVMLLLVYCGCVVTYLIGLVCNICTGF